MNPIIIDALDRHLNDLASFDASPLNVQLGTLNDQLRTLQNQLRSSKSKGRIRSLRHAISAVENKIQDVTARILILNQQLANPQPSGYSWTTKIILGGLALAATAATIYCGYRVFKWWTAPQAQLTDNSVAEAAAKAAGVAVGTAVVATAQVQPAVQVVSNWNNPAHLFAKRLDKNFMKFLEKHGLDWMLRHEHISQDIYNYLSYVKTLKGWGTKKLLDYCEQLLEFKSDHDMTWLFKHQKLPI